MIYDDEWYTMTNFSFILIILRGTFSLHPGQTNFQISVTLISRAPPEKYSHEENMWCFLFGFSKYGSISLIMNDS